MKSNIVVNHPKQLSRRWAQRIVSHYVPDAKVLDLIIESMDVGTTTRIKVKVKHDAAEFFPTRWFIKTPSLFLKSRAITALPRLLHKEIHFYKSLSDTLPVKLPQILAAQSRFGIGSTLVMTNLDEAGLMPGQPMDALSFQQAKNVIEQLAQFHVHHWGNTNLLNSNRWLGGINLKIENHLGTLLAVPLMKKGLSIAGNHIPFKQHARAIHYAANRQAVMKFLAAGEQTLVHHDCHPGNLFWNASEPGFLDWQLVRMGEGISDIAYFLATSLKPECRRTYETELLAIYLKMLEAAGLQGLDENKLYQRYRAHLTYAFEAMVVTLAVGGMMDYTSNLELIRRTSAAVEDHDSFSAISL